MRAAQTLDIKHPIIQGPFGGGLSSVSLLTTISNAGGLGSFGAHYMSPDEIQNLVQNIKKHTNKPFAINLWVKDHDGEGLDLSKRAYDEAYKIIEPYFIELGLSKPNYPSEFGARFNDQVEMILKLSPPVFSFVYGIPSPEIIRECQKRNIKTIGTATTLDEAVALDNANVDLIVATGAEAGGHRVSFIKPAEDSLMGTMSLVPQVVDHVKAPVIAAGGIADKRGMNAAIALGAEAVQIGTAFLACEESNASNIHKEYLKSAHNKHTALTRVFTGRLARGIENRIITKMNEHNYAPYPAQGWLMKHLNTNSINQNRAELMALWCGQSAPLIKYHFAEELFNSLI